MIEIIFRGRGGQGVVIASEILGRTFFMEGKYPQSFALFGSERRGAPVVGFLRVDDKPILLKCQIKHPDQMVIFDPSLIEETDLLKEVKPGGALLINGSKEGDVLRHLKGFKVGWVDAGLIARNSGLGDNFNMAMLGSYVRLTHLVRMETLIEAIRVMVPSRKEANIQAAIVAYEKTVLLDGER